MLFQLFLFSFTGLTNLIQFILTLLTYQLPMEARSYQSTLRQAIGQLRDVQTFQTPAEARTSSNAYRAFDHTIHRRLISLMPVKVLPLPTQEDAWRDYAAFLDGLREVYEMSLCPSVLEIKVRDTSVRHTSSDLLIL